MIWLFWTFCFLHSGNVTASGIVFEEHFDNLLISMVRFCWSYRSSLAFTEEKHHFDLDLFPQDRLRSSFEKWRHVPARSLQNYQLSIPNPEDIRENENNYLVFNVYNDGDLFNALVANPAVAPINLQDFITGFSAAHLAVLRGDYDKLSLLLKTRPQLAHVDIKSTKTTPLHFAVLLEQYECIAVLLKSGANSFVLDMVGNSPLDLVLSKGDVKTLKLLIDHGSVLRHKSLKQISAFFIHAGLFSEAVWSISRGATTKITDTSKKANLLHLAVKLRDPEAFKMLRERIAEGDIVWDTIVADAVEILELIPETSLNRRINQKTLLVIAVESRSAACLNYLAQKSLTANIESLQEIALLATRNAFVPALEFIFTCGLSANHVIGGITLLGHALRAEQFHLASWMITQRAGRLDLVKLDGRSRIDFYAFYTGNRSLLLFLFRFGLEPNFILPNGDRVLNYLIESSNFNEVLWFLDQGANPSLPDSKGISAIYLVSEHPNLRFKSDFLARLNLK